jgi:hypothetical protein
MNSDGSEKVQLTSLYMDFYPAWGHDPASPINPTPELSAGILFGFGLCGIGGLILVRKLWKSQNV